jgi:hypothetical protein
MFDPADLLTAENDARSTLVQALAGIGVLAGAIITWRQVQLGREGQSTDGLYKLLANSGTRRVLMCASGYLRARARGSNLQI